MITRVTPENTKKYEKLFKEAEELIRKYSQTENAESVTIGDLYEYFIAFPTILSAAAEKDISEDNKTGDDKYYQKYFTILPLDEPVFEIDANTRAITVPSQFKNIGVAGDNTAEIIFFSIDRFFDAIDFGAPNIKAVIEWHRTTGNNQDSYVDEAYIKELTLKDNKVLIGWVIDDRITEEPGAIEFAIRLYIQQGQEIIYSFSTSTAKVNIIKTLNFYATDVEVEKSAIEQIKNRILNTKSPDVFGDNVLNAPEYKVNVGDLLDDDGNPTTFNYITNNDFYADFNEDGNFIAKVEAQSTNGNASKRLLYRWYKYNELNKSWLVYPSNASEAVDGNEVSIDSIGKFKCMAIDNIGIRRATKDSQTLHILGPQKPVVKIADSGKYTSVILTDEVNGAKLEVQPYNSDQTFYTDEYDEQNKTKLSFEWKQNQNINDDTKIDIENAYEQEYSAKEEGYYYGYAVTQRNLKIETSQQASVYRVTRPLDIPTEFYTISGIQYPSALQGYVGEPVTIDFNVYDENGEVEKSYQYDNIKYQWFMAEDNLGDTFEMVDGVEARGTVSGGKISFKPSIRGYYTIKLLINRNGQTLPENNFDENNPETWYQLEYSINYSICG